MKARGRCTVAAGAFTVAIASASSNASFFAAVFDTHTSAQNAAAYCGAQHGFASKRFFPLVVQNCGSAPHGIASKNKHEESPNAACACKALAQHGRCVEFWKSFTRRALGAMGSACCGRRSTSQDQGDAIAEYRVPGYAEEFVRPFAVVALSAQPKQATRPASGASVAATRTSRSRAQVTNIAAIRETSGVWSSGAPSIASPSTDKPNWVVQDSWWDARGHAPGAQDDNSHDMASDGTDSDGTDSDGAGSGWGNWIEQVKRVSTNQIFTIMCNDSQT